MKKEHITQEMRNLMEVVREQQEIVLSHTGKIPQIELDILMGNLRKLYECLYSLQRLNETPQPTHDAPDYKHHHTDELLASIELPNAAEAIPVNHQPSSPVTAPVTEATVATATAAAAPIAARESEQTPKHIQPEALLTPIDTPVAAPVQEIINEEVMPQAALSHERAKEFSKPSAKANSTATLFDDAPATVADQFTGSPSLYDKISGAKEDKSIATKLQKHPVTDLKKSIGINDKFSFINELFEGDLNAYNEAIERLNASDSHTNAVSYLQEDLVNRYGWDGESESFQKLRNLIDRRFLA